MKQGQPWGHQHKLSISVAPVIISTLAHIQIASPAFMSERVCISLFFVVLIIRYVEHGISSKVPRSSIIRNSQLTVN